MGRSTRSGGGRHPHHHRSSQTLPSSPTHSLSSSSSDFEFTVSISPRKSSAALCPADELFYKGQLLPLQLSPRLSMVRTLLLSSPSSSAAATDSSRDSSGSSSDFSSCCDSSRPSSAADPSDEELKRLHNFTSAGSHQIRGKTASSGKYFSLPKLSAVFRKDAANAKTRNEISSVKRMSASAKEVIRKYLKKVKPLYEKLSAKQQQQQQKMSNLPSKPDGAIARSATTLCAGGDPSPVEPEPSKGVFNHSFSGNLRYPRIGSSKRSSNSTAIASFAAASSCPSSMRSSPSHSGVLGRGGSYAGPMRTGSGGVAAYFHGGDSATSTMEELQSAIQGAIAHCKNSMMIQQQQGKQSQGKNSNFGLNVI